MCIEVIRFRNCTVQFANWGSFLKSEESVVNFENFEFAQQLNNMGQDYLWHTPVAKERAHILQCTVVQAAMQNHAPWGYTHNLKSDYQNNFKKCV